MRRYNPYETLTDVASTSTATSRDRRWYFLVLPPFIPLIFHSVFRFYIPPGGRPPYLEFITMGAILPACLWAQLMIDRLKLSLGKTYVLTCAVWGAVVAVAMTCPLLVSWIVDSP